VGPSSRTPAIPDASAANQPTGQETSANPPAKADASGLPVLLDRGRQGPCNEQQVSPPLSGTDGFVQADYQVMAGERGPHSHAPGRAGKKSNGGALSWFDNEDDGLTF